MTKAKLTAFATKHHPMPTVLTRTAAAVGPMTLAAFTDLRIDVLVNQASIGVGRAVVGASAGHVHRVRNGPG